MLCWQSLLAMLHCSLWLEFLLVRPLPRLLRLLVLLLCSRLIMLLMYVWRRLCLQLQHCVVRLS